MSVGVWHTVSIYRMLGGRFQSPEGQRLLLLWMVPRASRSAWRTAGACCATALPGPQPAGWGQSSQLSQEGCCFLLV